LDVALVKIEEKNLPVVKLGDSDNVKLGQTVIAIGNSLSEYPNTITKGIISGRNRRVVAGDGAGARLSKRRSRPTRLSIPEIRRAAFESLGRGNRHQSASTAPARLSALPSPSTAFKKIVQSVKQYGRIVRPCSG